MPWPHVWGVKSKKGLFFYIFLTMTTPRYFQPARDLSEYMKCRLQSSASPTDPRPVPPTWLLAPGPRSQVEKAINLLQEAWSCPCKSYLRPAIAD
jgi:hypothetical protein